MKFLVLGFLCSGFAFSAEHVMGQKGKSFSPADLSISKGDSVVFSNDDDTVHNVLIKSASVNVNSAQKPGDKHKETFSEVGDYDVRCAIHPNMRAKIKVK